MLRRDAVRVEGVHEVVLAILHLERQAVEQILAVATVAFQRGAVALGELDQVDLLHDLLPLLNFASTRSAVPATFLP